MSANQTQVFTGKGVEGFRWASVKAQLKMEKVGLKSSGGPLRPRLAKELGLKARDSYEMYIAAVEEKLLDIRQAIIDAENERIRASNERARQATIYDIYGGDGP